MPSKISQKVSQKVVVHVNTVKRRRKRQQKTSNNVRPSGYIQASNPIIHHTTNTVPAFDVNTFMMMRNLLHTPSVSGTMPANNPPQPEVGDRTLNFQDLERLGNKNIIAGDEKIGFTQVPVLPQKPASPFTPSPQLDLRASFQSPLPKSVKTPPIGLSVNPPPISLPVNSPPINLPKSPMKISLVRQRKNADKQLIEENRGQVIKSGEKRNKKPWLA